MFGYGLRTASRDVGRGAIGAMRYTRQHPYAVAGGIGVGYGADVAMRRYLSSGRHGLRGRSSGGRQ